MLDFSSALYLGFRHPSAALSPWPQLTSGTPATMGVPEESVVVARRLADLLGATRATLLPSTLHLFWDLFVLLAGTDGTIFVDAGAYPIARSGVERAAARGIPVRQFPHHDPDALARVLRRAAGRRPLVLVDGICPECGAPPLRAYSELTARQGGTLVIDDTQALGVLGVRQPHARPFGAGGGGSLRWHGLAGPHIVIGASLAKGFGVPLAVLAGAASVVARFERGAETRMHGSPPSMAAIRAAEHALELNRVAGDGIRHRLGRLVVRFRAGSPRLVCAHTRRSSRSRPSFEGPWQYRAPTGSARAAYAWSSTGDTTAPRGSVSSSPRPTTTPRSTPHSPRSNGRSGSLPARHLP